jgi:mono/diheme cytochrome c family protein
MLAGRSASEEAMRLGSRHLATLAALGGLAGPAAAADLPGDPRIGLRLAEDVCSECHAVAADRPDPGIGPSFVEAVDHPSVTEMSLRAFLQTPHADMPDIRLGREETDDIVAYLLTLRRR